MNDPVQSEAAPGTAVAFLVFNRPDCTRRTFAAIREARPERLLVVADGPRPDRPGEAERCAETRAIIAQGVDWPCQVEEQYSAANLGCRKRVSSGLDWVFSRVEEAIILEDDCLPDPSFFAYASELLARYRANERVWSISGNNFLSEDASDPASYRFSRIPHIWGWATWRRAWRHYDVEIKGWPEFLRQGGMKTAFAAHRDQRRVWTEMLQQAHEGRIDTWDYQWCFASLAQGGMHIMPRRNLVTNIGFDANATHTTDADSVHAGLDSYPVDQPLRHPAKMEIDVRADYATFLATAGLGQPSFAARIRRGTRTALRRVASTFAPASRG